MNGKIASDIMTQPVVCVRPDELLTDAMKLMLRHHVSGVVVAGREGEMLGVISERDVLNFALSGNAADTRVEEAMTRQVVSMPPEADMAALVNCLTSRPIRRVPIVKDGRAVGIVSRRDVLREMLEMYGKYH